MKLKHFTAAALMATLLSGCFPNSPKIQYVDVSTGKPIEVKVPPAPLEEGNPLAGVQSKVGYRYITRADGSVGVFTSNNTVGRTGLRRICIDGIVYLQDTHTLTPHLVRDTTNHPLMGDEDSGSRVRLKGVTCK